MAHHLRKMPRLHGSAKNRNAPYSVWAEFTPGDGAKPGGLVSAGQEVGEAALTGATTYARLIKFFDSILR